MDVQLKKGLLEVCVLAVLYESDSYGYQLIRDLSGCVEVSESTLYPILKRLEGSDMLKTYKEEYNGRLRKYYSLLPKGKRRLHEFTGEWERIEEIGKFILGRIH